MLVNFGSLRGVWGCEPLLKIISSDLAGVVGSEGLSKTVPFGPRLKALIALQFPSLFIESICSAVGSNLANEVGGRGGVGRRCGEKVHDYCSSHQLPSLPLCHPFNQATPSLPLVPGALWVTGPSLIALFFVVHAHRATLSLWLN